MTSRNGGSALTLATKSENVVVTLSLLLIVVAALRAIRRGDEFWLDYGRHSWTMEWIRLAQKRLYSARL